jgi:hypothetical protein
VYAEVGFPLVTALGLGPPAASGVLLATSVVCAFLLHEPTLVLMGRRGARIKAAAGVPARRLATVLGVLCLVAGAAGIWLGGALTRRLAIGAIPIVFVLGWLIATRREKSWLGEGFVATVLPFASVPVALGCGVAVLSAVAAASIWALGFLLETATVQSMLARAKRSQRGPAAATIAVALCLATLALGVAVAWGAAWPLAAVPPAVTSGTILAAGTAPPRLRTVGWCMIASNAVTAAVLVASLRV